MAAICNADSLAQLILLMEKVWGPCKVRAEQDKFVITKAGTWDPVATLAVGTNESWIKITGIPEKKQEEVDKVLTTGRFSNIINQE